VVGGLLTRYWGARAAGMAGLVALALVLDENVQPLGREFMTPLDEGMVMDMPITVRRASVTQSADDLKARDMFFCRFPEVDMVVGKAGRAETPTDPAPMDMIETMINFRPAELWPKRRVHQPDAERQTAFLMDNLERSGLASLSEDANARKSLVDEVTRVALPRFDALMREYCY